MWTDDKVRMLIDERKEGNAHYHSLGGGRQASEKFHGIVKDCRSIEFFTDIWTNNRRIYYNRLHRRRI
ncbi:7095_t:CDS:2, partial [Rhizophagus irregularis]